MFKKVKVLILISVFMFVFGIASIGVLALNNATYVLDGSIEYKIDSALVEVQTKIYSSAINYTESELQEKILEVQNAEFNNQISDLTLISTSERYSSIEDETTEVKTKDCSSTFELTYSNSQSTYFFVTNVKNLISFNNVWAVVQDEFSAPQNSNIYSNYLRQDNTIQNQPHGQNMVVVLTKKPGANISDTEKFDYSIKIGVGELGHQDFNLNKLVFTYHSSSSGSYYSVKAKDTSIAGTVVIPGFYDNGSNGLLKVSQIDYNGFANCDKIRNISFSEQITSVNSSAFSKCYNLKSVYAHSLKNWCEINFSSTTANPIYYAKNLFVEGKFINNTVNIPNTVTKMGSYTFANYTRLKTVNMADSVTSVGYGTFYDCINLKNVKLSNQLTNLGGSMFYACENLETIEIPQTITNVGYGCFMDCYELKACNLPKSATTVGGRIWAGCSSLEEITVTDIPSGSWGEEFANLFGLTNFSGNDYWVPPLKRITFFNITSVSGLPPTLEEINLPSCMVSCEFNNTFWYKNFDDFDENGLGTITACDDPDYKILVKVDPLKVKRELTAEALDGLKLSQGTFSNCINLEKVEFPSSIDVIPPSCFSGCANLKEIVFSETITQISDSAFKGCVSLTEVVIPDSVTSISSYAFSNCTSLSNISLSQNLISLGSNVFEYCSKITEIILPDTLTSLGTSFKYCTGLKSIYIPKNVTSISSGCFVGSKEIESVIVDPENETYSSSNGEKEINCIYNKNTNTLFYAIDLTDFDNIPTTIVNYGMYSFSTCTNLGVFEIPSNITTIRDSAFRYCTGIKELVIPSTVTSVERMAFAECTSLEKVDFNPSITVMNYALFTGCSSLVEFYIPNYITMLNNAMFEKCSSLKSIYIPSSVTKIDSVSVFSGCNSLSKVYIDDLQSYCNINFADTSACPLSYGAQLIIKGETEDSIVTELVVDDSLQNINNYAFYGYKHLVGLTITNSSATIGTSTFSGANKLVYIKNTTGNSVTVPSNANQIVTTDASYVSPISYVEDYIIYNYKSADGLSDIKYLMGTTNLKLQDVVVPQGVTQIYTRAFYNNQEIKTINLGDTVEIINDYAFYGTSIKELTIPRNVNKIKYYAFYGCKNLNDLILENNPNLEIDSYSFYSCPNILFLKNLTGKSFDSYKIPYNEYRITVTTDETADTGITEENGVIVFTRDSKKYLYAVLDKTLTTYTIPEDVNIICSNAFLDCLNLTSITIPNSVEIIGPDAFKNCTKLNYVNVNDINNWLKISFANQYATPLCYASELYVQNQKLTTLNLPEEITEIKNYAFYNIKSLQSITLHNALLKINSYAFSNTGISSVQIPNSVTTYGSYIFAGCSNLSIVNLPDNIKAITSGMFQNCTSLINLTIPNSVESFSSYAFYGCVRIKGIQIPQSSITYVSAYVFYNCISLETIVIPASITSIHEYAFYNCSAKFENLSNLTYISKYAFYGCKGLTEINLSKVTSLSEYSFAYCSNLQTVVLSDKMTTIPRYLFYSCSRLKNIQWPTNLVTISNSAFEYSGLVNVVLPSTVKTIESSAFEGCYYLESIILPEGLTTLNSNRVFFYCWSLKELVIPESVTSISSTDWLWVNCKSLKRLEINCRINDLYLEQMISLETLILKFPPSQIYLETCTRLDYIKLPEGLTRFGCFSYSDNVKVIDLPSTVTYVGYFSDTSVDKLIVRAVIPPDIADGQWSRLYTGTPIYVPQESVEAYKSDAKWSRYKDTIFAIESLED